MFRKFIVLAAISTIGASAFALDNDQVQRSVQLKDASTVHIFKDGKMAMEDKYGRAVRMEPGHVMDAKNGEKITMHGDEVGRLASILFVPN
ncbi:MAG: periplasmic Cu(I)/Cu(II)-binding protein CopK [Betaproteobacteria bacterium]|nr:periplasmic Cu(I)/Cu(II)-binding protein CopK [Betaproteobacteria bacterium]